MLLIRLIEKLLNNRFHWKEIIKSAHTHTHITAEKGCANIRVNIIWNLVHKENQSRSWISIERLSLIFDAFWTISLRFILLSTYAINEQNRFHFHFFLFLHMRTFPGNYSMTWKGIHRMQIANNESERWKSTKLIWLKLAKKYPLGIFWKKAICF